MRRGPAYALAAALLAALIAGCTPQRPEQLRAAAQEAGAERGMRPLELRGAGFRLFALLRTAPGSRVLRIYIEGDGHAWLTSDTPSPDPTPWSPVALRLALRDPSAAVAYLARPCQYVGADSPACTPALWTGRRYGPEVVASLDAGIDRLLRLAGAAAVELVGYSGGGPLAALIAERRRDVASLRTVAGNLDTARWTAAHGVSPLRGSLDPADHATLLKGLPQVHFVGGSDDVVGEAVVRSFLRRMGDTRCAQLVVVPGTGHEDWDQAWPALLARRPACREPAPG